MTPCGKEHPFITMAPQRIQELRDIRFAKFGHPTNLRRDRRFRHGIAVIPDFSEANDVYCPSILKWIFRFIDLDLCVIRRVWQPSRILNRHLKIGLIRGGHGEINGRAIKFRTGFIVLGIAFQEIPSTDCYKSLAAVLLATGKQVGRRMTLP